MTRNIPNMPEQEVKNPIKFGENHVFHMSEHFCAHLKEW